ncbi:hypothetical protein OG500_33725 [Kitasatospora sp. NBC_01250]|uniref:hypothetical protein n=1 Tax=unclassified Kitasatospora TaxID=2633591 RepID=UPI002E11D5EB|nr:MULTISPECIES: hypothetical protein [unclassified Kitasatospora]WSJ70929.1 hypothetical protein OG294_35265 [Kitasatospora sp. NBC_01302]
MDGHSGGGDFGGGHHGGHFGGGHHHGGHHHGGGHHHRHHDGDVSQPLVPVSRWGSGGRGGRGGRVPSGVGLLIGIAAILVVFAIATFFH